MAEMGLLETWTGEERAFGRTAKLHAMRVPELGSPDRECHLSVAIRQGQGRAVRGPTRHDAYPGKIDDFGHWYEAIYDLDEGTVLRVKGHRSSGHGQRAAIASVYIQMRANAAMRTITFHATDGAGRRQPSYPINGRFDVLTREEVVAYAGPIPHWVSPELSDAAVARTFVIVETAPEISARPVHAVQQVISADGRLQQVVVPVRTRTIKL